MSYALIRGKVARVTKLDGCGNRVLGPKSQVTTSGFTTIALTANTNTGDAISVTNAAGAVCVSDTPAPTFTGYGMNLTFCQVEPELYNLLTGNPVSFAADGTTTNGFNVNSDTDQSASGFALEVWSSVPSANCSGGAQSYGYIIFPFVQGGIIGDFTIENAAITFQVTGATTKDGNNWGVGLSNVVKNVSNVDSPLNVALSTKNHMHVEQTTTLPPSTMGPGQVGVPATSAVAGIPGSYLPANSYGRANLAAMTGLTASPTSAWTVGQYVVCLDGSFVHWNATAWVAGPA